MTRKQATIAVRSGLNDDEQYGCVVPPIHLSSTYNFTGFNEPRAHDYSRRGNPTRDVTQRALAELEGGAGAVLTNTGMSAIHLVTTVFLKPGDLLVAPHDCYGGSYRLFDSLAKRGCYRVLFVDQNDEQALKQALAEQPKLVLVESPSNPLLRVVDIAKICQLARDAGAISVVDNTFLSPALQNPLALGADLVLHSCTKYLNGHSDVVAGVVIAKDPEVVTELAWWANNIGVTASCVPNVPHSRRWTKGCLTRCCNSCWCNILVNVLSSPVLSAAATRAKPFCWAVTALTTRQRRLAPWRACPASPSGATWPVSTARTRAK